MQARVWARIAFGLASLVGAGCNSADGSRQAPDLTRRDPEPIGANCAHGGTAVHTGADRDADGVLDDNEIIDTVYECNDGPMTLMRDDVIAPNATCPGGSIVTRTGIDDNNDGSLEDSEIDLSTVRCNSLDRWTGDFTAANWSDALKVTALRGARVVDGSLTIAATGQVELPLLETVHGDLVVRGPMTGLALPRLRQVDGSVAVDAPGLRALSFAVLEQIDGELSIENNDELGASLDAPQLRTVARLVFGANAHGVVSMPRLTIVGGLVDDGQLEELHLDALIAVAGDVSVGGRRLSALSLPSLAAIEGALRVDQALSIVTIDLPVLDHIDGDLHMEGLVFLTTLSLPLLRDIGGGSLTISGNTLLPRFELTSLVTINHDLTIASNPAMMTLSGLDALTSLVGTLVIEHNDRIPPGEVNAFRARLRK